MDMESTLRVVLSHSDETGCGHYRCFYPAEALGGDSSLSVEILPRKLDRLDLSNPGVVVLQRPIFQKIADTTIPYLRSQGWAVVVEIDDNLSKLHPTHFAFHLFHPRNKDANWLALEQSAAQADLVTVTTNDLARQYAAHGRFAVLPNMVPERFVVDEVPPEREHKRFGWAGGLASHPGDLDVARKAITRGASQPGWTFAGIGDPAICRYLGVDGESLPGTSVEDWLPALGQLDLGLAPLAQHRFNEGKSYLKGLEMAARGVPFIATPTEPYSELENMGAGVTCFSQKDWVRTLRDLMTDTPRRRELAESGLATARLQTYERNAYMWSEAWHLARQNYEKNITKEDIAAGRRVHVEDIIIR